MGAATALGWWATTAGALLEGALLDSEAGLRAGRGRSRTIAGATPRLAGIAAPADSIGACRGPCSSGTEVGLEIRPSAKKAAKIAVPTSATVSSSRRSTYTRRLRM